MLRRHAFTTVASLWCFITILLWYKYMGNKLPIHRRDVNASVTEDAKQRTMVISALNEFIRNEIKQKWHTNHLKVVPVSGTMISSLRGGILCDDDFDVAIYDQSSVHLDIDQWNTELVEFVLNRYSKFSICERISGVSYKSCSINMTALATYSRSMLPSSSPHHNFTFDSDLNIHIDMMFPFMFIEDDNNKTYLHAGNTEIYSPPTWMHEPAEWWLDDMNCQCYWPHTTFDCPCDERHAISILHEWERPPATNNSTQQRPASEYENTCLWVPPINKDLRERPEIVQIIQTQINRAHLHGFITFKSLMDITLDTDNNMNKNMDNYTHYNWPSDMLPTQVIHCQPAAQLLLFATKSFNVPCD